MKGGGDEEGGGGARGGAEGEMKRGGEEHAEDCRAEHGPSAT